MSSSTKVAESTKKLVLIVDDDTEVRSVMASLLTSQGYNVLQAQDGNVAVSFIKNRKPDVIVSDVRVPKLDGIELLKLVRSTSRTPFILMTGFSEVVESQQAHDLGATDFITKPFRKEELLASIELALSATLDGADREQSKEDREDEEDQDLDFCRLSVDEFVTGKVSLADIFVRLSHKKYVQVARVNSELSFDRIQAYKLKGLHFLYIRKEDFARYIGLNLELTKAVRAKTSVPRSLKLRLMKHTSEILLQDVYINGIEKEKLEESAALVEAMVSTLSEDKDLFELLQILQTHSDALYAHSLGVALYGVMVAKHIGWTSTPTVFKVVMGGLLHDIGKKEIPRAILEKPRHQFTSEERSVYETHPIRGKEILGFISSVPEDIAQIALHHHENIAGRGFPFRLSKPKIHPLAKLIAVTNEFCDLALKGCDGHVPLEAHQALERLYSSKQQELDLGLLRALMEICNHEIPEGILKSTVPSLF